ncbi:hypothetical protein FD525_11920 [Cutibacterium acnes]|nr:hypothetical protein F8231_09050 [Cutibacterium acnes]QEW96300.1 hypothetical protein F6X01_09275 [Cutibacterium acnes]TLF83069.1 hypothetical protein FD532_05740 [Cutibacterium acnes]TLF89836.1 hypothetical protein FD531_05385 [Cutibacterium acnes]TLG03126.1 hypothetical protein FD525_11920 [Cutibacterium acnes]
MGGTAVVVMAAGSFGCGVLGEIRLLAVDIRTSDASTIEMVVVARLEQQLERVRGAVKACLCVH